MEIRANGISETAFEEVFKTHFTPLHAYAMTILREDVMAEEIVQQVFVRLWEKKENIRIRQSVAAYLYGAVHNGCLNYLKHQKVKQAHHMHVQHTSGHSPENASRKLILKELEAKIADALSRLPAQCRMIFQMSRFEELKYREIAERLNLSVKTVENQMGKALKIMRTHLSDYLPVLFILIWNFFEMK